MRNQESVTHVTASVTAVHLKCVRLDSKAARDSSDSLFLLSYDIIRTAVRTD
jgi:hypothetical protein